MKKYILTARQARAIPMMSSHPISRALKMVTQGDTSNLAEQVSSPWTTTSNFTPPGPGITFDSSKSGMQTPPASATEVKCFKLFFTEELVGEIVEETNRHASELQEKMAPGVLGKMARWVPTTIKEMYLFLMAVLLMGVIKKPSLRHYWSTDPLLQTPFFGKLFSQDRFLLLLRCLHFTNSARVSHHDPLHKIRRIFTAITSSFRRVFVPYKDLCVDESLMKWKGRLAFRQYIPTKRSQFRVKFFVLCDVLTGYVQDMVIYTGSTTDICYYEGLGISGSVVMTLLAPYLGKGHVLYWRFSTAWYGTVRFGTVHFWGVFHWVLYLVPDNFLVPPQPRFQGIRTVTKTWCVNSADHWLAGENRHYCVTELATGDPPLQPTR